MIIIIKIIIILEVIISKYEINQQQQKQKN